MGIKSQVLYQKEKIKTAKTLKEKHQHPQNVETSKNNSSVINKAPEVIMLQTFSFNHHSSSGLTEETS